MKVFDELQKDIWMRQKRQAILAKLCLKGCDWLTDDGICISSTGCMYIKKEVKEDERGRPVAYDSATPSTPENHGG